MTDELKERFCRDVGIRISIFDDEVFEERVALLEKTEEWNEFNKLISERFNNDETAYFNYYNTLKDTVINHIKESATFKVLDSGMLGQYTVNPAYEHICKSDTWKPSCVGHKYISIDMKKANFTSLVAYGNLIGIPFFNSLDYEEFMSQFTDIEHVKKSKYIRQVVFGNCTPKRQITFEKYLMSLVLDYMLSSSLITKHDIYSFMHDEIILKADGIDDDKLHSIYNYVKENTETLTFQYFSVSCINIEGSLAYIKNIMLGKNEGNKEIKCVDPINSPIAYRVIKNEDIKESDLYFTINGRRAKFVEKPHVEILDNMEDS